MPFDFKPATAVKEATLVVESLNGALPTFTIQSPSVDALEMLLVQHDSVVDMPAVEDPFLSVSGGAVERSEKTEPDPAKPGSEFDRFKAGLPV
jgi:hypothetical protein